MRRNHSDIFSELECWYSLDKGQYLLGATRSAAQEFLDTAFGYHIVQLGVSGGRALCLGSPITHRLYCATRAKQDVGLIASPDELPLESDSVDAIIAYHCLEFTDNPHQVLREIQRVLTPQGQLLVIGFNPFSLQGISNRLRRSMRDPLWREHRPLSEHRLTDWLHLLGCEVSDTRWLYALPPVGYGRVRSAIAQCDQWAARTNLPVGGVYVLRATKQVVGMNRPRRPLFAGGKRLMGLVPKPRAVPAPTPRVDTLHNNRSSIKGNLVA